MDETAADPTDDELRPSEPCGDAEIAAEKERRRDANGERTAAADTRDPRGSGVGRRRAVSLTDDPGELGARARSELPAVDRHGNACAEIERAKREVAAARGADAGARAREERCGGVEAKPRRAARDDPEDELRAANRARKRRRVDRSGNRDGDDGRR